MSEAGRAAKDVKKVGARVTLRAVADRLDAVDAAVKTVSTFAQMAHTAADKAKNSAQVATLAAKHSNESAKAILAKMGDASVSTPNDGGMLGRLWGLRLSLDDALSRIGDPSFVDATHAHTSVFSLLRDLRLVVDRHGAMLDEVAINARRLTVSVESLLPHKRGNGSTVGSGGDLDLVALNRLIEKLTERLDERDRAYAEQLDTIRNVLRILDARTDPMVDQLRMAVSEAHLSKIGDIVAARVRRTDATAIQDAVSTGIMQSWAEARELESRNSLRARIRRLFWRD